jgi:hypothetical protein
MVIEAPPGGKIRLFLNFSEFFSSGTAFSPGRERAFPLIESRRNIHERSHKSFGFNNLVADGTRKTDDFLKQIRSFAYHEPSIEMAGDEPPETRRTAPQTGEAGEP